MAEAESLLNGVAATFEVELTSAELAVYSELEKHEQVAFRICRDLAINGENAAGG